MFGSLYTCLYYFLFLFYVGSDSDIFLNAKARDCGPDHVRRLLDNFIN